MEPVEFTGKTTEEALKKAAEHFQLPLDKLEVEVVAAGSSGLLGFIGAKKARVLVRPLVDSAREAMDEMMREFRGEEEASPAAKPAASTPTPEATPEAPPEPPRRHAIADYSDHPQEQAATPVAPPAAAPAEPPAPSAPLEAETGSPGEGGEEPGRGWAREPEPPEVVEAARQVLERMVSTLDAEAKVRVHNGAGGGIELEVEGGEVGILIGRRGQTLDALQYLTTRIVSHQEGRPVRISVDAGGYRRRRRQSLEDLARRMAAKAKNTKRPVSIGPLSSPERRVVHLALKGESGVSTSSRGRGELKKVLISPKG